MTRITPFNTKLELRRNEKGRFVLYFDGERVPGVIETVMHQEGPFNRPVFTLTFAGVAVRVVENVPTSEADEIVSLLHEAGS
jgi:hypothetical protein